MHAIIEISKFYCNTGLYTTDFNKNTPQYYQTRFLHEKFQYAFSLHVNLALLHFLKNVKLCKYTKPNPSPLKSK